MKKLEAEEDKRQSAVSRATLASERRGLYRFCLQLKNLKGKL